MFHGIWNLFQEQHIDAWITAAATGLPTLGAFSYFLYQKTSFSDVRRKEQLQLEKTKQRTQLLQSKEFEESIQNYERFVLNDARIAQIHIIGMLHPLNLLDIYVPLYLHPHSALPYTLDTLDRDGEGTLEPEALLSAAQKTLAHRVSESLRADEALHHYKRCVIVGDPGIGKTTLLRYLALKAASKELAQLSYTPVYIQLNTFDPEQHRDLFDLVLAQFSNFIALPDALDQLQQKMHAGKILLLCDGLDETGIGPNEKRTENTYVLLVKHIEQLAAMYPQMPMVIAVRKAGYQHRPKVKGFHELEIMDFRPEDSRAFVKNWFDTYPTQNKAEKVRELNTRLEHNLRIQSLASNPLLLSLITIVYERHHHLPEQRGDLYKKCIAVLQNQWDASRDIQRKHGSPLAYQSQLLQEVAWHFHNQRKRYFPLHELLQAIERFLQTVNVPPERSRQILEQIMIENGLLREYAEDWYGFSHLTFQEYFVTHFIITNQQQETLLQYLDDPWWEEVFVLYASSLQDASPLLSALLEPKRKFHWKDDLFQTRLMLAGRCLVEKSHVSNRALRTQITRQLFQALEATPYTLAREHIAHTLAGMDSPEVNARLLTLLASPASCNLSVRESVGRALGYAGARALAPELVSLLTQGTLERYMRIVIAHALSIMGETSIVSSLLNLIADEQEDPFVRQSVASTLGILGDSNIVPALLKICQRQQEHALVLQSITLAFEKLQDMRAVPVLWNLLREKHLDWYTRGRCAQVLGRLGSKEDVPLLLDMLEDQDENTYIRRCVALAIGTLERTDISTDYLLDLLEYAEIDASIRASIASSFVTIGDRTVIPQLIALFKNEHTHPKIRMSVALTLGLLGESTNVQVMNVLNEAYYREQSDKHLHASVVVAMGMLGVRVVVYDLIDLLIDPDLPQDMLPHIAHALSSLESHSIIDKEDVAHKLVDLLRRADLDRLRGQCIIQVLCSLRVIEIVPKLCKILSNPAIDRSVRHEVADCVAQLAQDKATEATLHALLASTDIPDDIYRALWIVSRHVKRA